MPTSLSGRARAVIRVADGHELARGDALTHALDVGPRQRRQVDRLVGVDRRRVPDRGEVDVHVPKPRRPHRECRREHHRSCRSRGDRGQPRRDVHVRRGEHAGIVELAQQPVDRPDAARVKRIRLHADGAHRATP